MPFIKRTVPVDPLATARQQLAELQSRRNELCEALELSFSQREAGRIARRDALLRPTVDQDQAKTLAVAERNVRAGDDRIAALQDAVRELDRDIAIVEQTFATAKQRSDLEAKTKGCATKPMSWRLRSRTQSSPCRN